MNRLACADRPAEGLVLGLTGIMGGGKSTVAGLLGELGYRVFSADGAVRALLDDSLAVRAAIGSRFGQTVLTGEGRVDRAALAARVFASDVDLEWLEGLLHPEVLAAEKAWSEMSCGCPGVSEVPLLFEKSLERRYRATVTVSCDPGTQRARLRAKGFSETDIERRIAKQLPNIEKIRRADFVLTNSGSLEFLRRQVHRLVGLLSSPPPYP